MFSDHIWRAPYMVVIAQFFGKTPLYVVGCLPVESERGECSLFNAKLNRLGVFYSPRIWTRIDHVQATRESFGQLTTRDAFGKAANGIETRLRSVWQDKMANRVPAIATAVTILDLGRLSTYSS